LLPGSTPMPTANPQLKKAAQLECQRATHDHY